MSTTSIDIDRRRARELYKYFQPDDPAFLTSARQDSRRSSHSSTKSSSSRRPLSPNITLTSYAQLVAIRLNASRALISLVDEDDLYDIAEATKSLDISNTDVFADEGDGLWVGCQRVPKSGRLCAHTVDLPARGDGESNFFIVNDLTKDPRFAELPYVIGEPHFKFYAGTPITTRNGVNIGSLFILDVKPRDGLTDDDKGFLASMASVCISYLELVRDAAEGRKIARMSQALHSFVEGKMSFIHTDKSVYDDPLPAKTTISLTNGDGKAFNESAEIDVGIGNDDIEIPTEEPPLRRNTSRHELSEAEKDTFSRLTDNTNSKTKQRLEILAESESLEREWTLARAANLLREALDLDGHGGVVIYDARNTSVKFSPETTIHPSGSFDSDREAPDSPAEFPTPNRVQSSIELSSEHDSLPSAAAHVHASILATSCTSEPLSVGDNFAAAATSEFRPMPMYFMNKFLARYQGGKIWDFDYTENTSIEATRSGARRAEESEFLMKFFPGVRHLIFIPMWEPSSSRWCSGAFAWNTVDTRAFSNEAELTFSMSFGKSVMAEISRIETIKADRLKGDFIGSISHELRSPLHGVLASLDFLTETKFDPFQESLINTIEACGRTLLDTINHVLNYSKVNSVERNWRRGKKTKKQSVNLQTLPDQSAALVDAPLLNQYDHTNVAAMLEEVVEGVVAGYSYKDIGSQDITTMQPLARAGSRGSTHRRTLELSNPQSLGSKGIEIMLDIEPGDWMFMTQPGALRRCFMNIFGNAVKYTDKGSILVRLEAATPPPEKKDEVIIRFIVKDTGRGISTDFLRSKIFTPFAQEDHLSPGTGLGLSIVRSITNMLGGSIDVKSQLGVGTSVIVEIPLSRRTEAESQVGKPRQSEQPGKDSISLLKQEAADKTFVIYGYDPNIVNPKSPINYLSGYIKDWFKLKVLAWNPNVLEADVILTRNDRLPVIKEMLKNSPPMRRGLILVSTTVNHNLTTYDSPGDDVEVLYTSKPCGPYKLSKVLHQCVSRLNQPSRAAGEKVETPASEGGEIMADIDGQRQVDVEDKLNIPVLTEEDSIINSLPSLSKVASTEVLEMKRRSASSIVVPIPDGTSMNANVDGCIESNGKVTVPTIATTKREPRILLVEDNKINLRLLQTFIKKRNYKCVDSAEHGGLAIEAVEKAEEPYDVIFMDISMPILNGFEATQAIREIEAKQAASRTRASNEPTNGSTPPLVTPRATIIALTGLASARDQNEAFAAGVDLYITKPVSFKEVGRLLDQWEAAVTTNAAAPTPESSPEPVSKFGVPVTSSPASLEKIAPGTTDVSS